METTNTQHTPAPWKVSFLYGVDQYVIEPRLYNGKDLTEEEKATGQANARIIASAPDNTECNFKAYVYLLNHMPREHRNTIDGQGMLASMRSSLANAYDIDPQKLEAIAHESDNKFSAPGLKAENERLNTLVQSQKDDIDNLQEFTVKIEALNAELLGALKMLYTAFPKHGAFENDQVKACIYAKAAIAKAEGKG